MIQEGRERVIKGMAIRITGHRESGWRLIKRNIVESQARQTSEDSTPSETVKELATN